MGTAPPLGAVLHPIAIYCIELQYTCLCFTASYYDILY